MTELLSLEEITKTVTNNNDANNNNNNNSDYNQLNPYIDSLYFIKEQMQILQKENEKKGSRDLDFLDFGTGEGYSLRMLFKSFNTDIISDVWLYDIERTDLRHISRIEFKYGTTYHFTETLPKKKFDFISMFFVAGIDISALEQAYSILNEGGNIILFDYDIEYENQNEILELCDSNLERQIINRQGIDYFIKRVTRFKSSDYSEICNQLGMQTIRNYKNVKFGVNIFRKK